MNFGMQCAAGARPIDMQKSPLLTISVFFLFVIFIVLVFVVSSAEIQYTISEKIGENQPIAIIGKYQIDDGPWLEFTNSTKFSASAYHTITLKGHFPREIPKGQTLLFFIPRVYITLFIDGNEAFSFESRAAVSFAGTAWAEYLSPGISADSEIELVMRNAYRNSNVSFNALIESMQTGSRAGLYQQMFRDNGGILAFGLFFIFASIVALLLAAIAWFLHVPHSSKAASLALFAVAGSIYFVTDMNYLYMPLFFSNPSVVSMLDILALYITPTTFTFCVAAYVGQKVKPWAKFFAAVQCLLIAVMLVFQMTGVIQLYEAQPFFIATIFIMIVLPVVFILYDTYKFDNKETKGFLLTALPALVGALAESFNYFFHFMPMRVLFATGASITLVFQIFYIIYIIKRSSEAALSHQKLKNELTQSRISVMLSQIQPHFLYNSLVAIRELCLIDAQAAHKTVTEFSNYLRGNLDSLSITKPIPFAREINHVENYLELEKRRFESRLRIVYDISVREFMLPALTLQLIVENAVRHGVTKRQEGGTVTISTAETEKDWVITVADDGVGFSPGEAHDDRIRMGIENVRNRLASMCGGSLDIQSTPGVGTTAVILIPK
jgi:signal transduction histidine kinase